MLTNEMRYRICDEFLEKDEISTKQLRDLGIKKHDIQKLVEEKTLIRVKRGLYKFSNVELLCEYALCFLRDSRKTDDRVEKREHITRADKCFKLCHSMNNKSRDVNLRLLLHFIVTKNYEKAYEVLEDMYNTDNKDTIKENNLFLYLLSCHEKCPLGLYERISSICLEDLTLGGLDDEFSKLIISLIYTQEFDRVKELITNLVVDDSSVSVKISILKALLNRSILNIRFADLRAVLKENRVDDFYKLLFIYLRIIGREEYNYLIIWLTKLCVLDNDLTFDLVFRELVELEKADYYDVSAVFISSFYQYVFSGKYKQASICLKIIEKYGCLSSEVVDDLRKKVDKGVNHKESTKSDLASLNQNDYDDVKKELSNIIKCMKNDGELVHTISGVSDAYCDCVRKIFEEKPLASGFENIKVWNFGNDSQTIILRLINPQITRINIGETLKNIFSFFNTGRYGECIALINELLQYDSFEIRSLEKTRNLFYVLGISYIKSSSHVSKSRKFLALTTEINGLLPKELQDGKYDLNLLVNKLSDKKTTLQHNGNRNRVIATAGAVLLPREDIKLNGFFGEDDSSSDIVLRLSRLQDILYTGLELGKSLEDIGGEYNLVEEDILLIRLIKARDYYVDDLYQEGDNELRKVTLSANKTPLVESFIFHILNHKFDYRRMKSAYVRKLVCSESDD